MYVCAYVMLRIECADVYVAGIFFMACGSLGVTRGIIWGDPGPTLGGGVGVIVGDIPGVYPFRGLWAEVGPHSRPS